MGGSKLLKEVADRVVHLVFVGLHENCAHPGLAGIDRQSKRPAKVRSPQNRLAAQDVFDLGEGAFTRLTPRPLLPLLQEVSQRCQQGGISWHKSAVLAYYPEEPLQSAATGRRGEPPHRLHFGFGRSDVTVAHRIPQ